MKRILPCFLLLSFTLLLTNCHKCEDQLLQPEFDHYFTGFKVGSYWIYENEQNGSLDSVYVDAYTRSFGGPKGSCMKEYVVVTFKGWSFTNAPVYGRASLDQGIAGDGWSIGTDIGTLFSAWNINFSTPDTFMIDNQLYTQVFKLNCDCDFPGYDKITWLKKTYYAKGIGMIYWQMVNHPLYGEATYKLIRYKIIP